MQINIVIRKVITGEKIKVRKFLGEQVTNIILRKMYYKQSSHPLLPLKENQQINKQDHHYSQKDKKPYLQLGAASFSKFIL